MRRRQFVTVIGAAAVAGCLCGRSTEEAAAEEISVVVESTEYDRDVLTNAFEDYQKGLNCESDGVARREFDVAEDSANDVHDALSDPLRKLKDGMRSSGRASDGRALELYELAVNFILRTRNAADYLSKAADMQKRNDNDTAQVHFEAANTARDESAKLGEQLAAELKRV